MTTVPTQIRIDANIEREAVEVPQYSQKTLDAMAEALRISRDPDIKGYSSIEELKAALED